MNQLMFGVLPMKNYIMEKFRVQIRLVNGNTLICEGDFGMWEVTPDGEVVWKYESNGISWRAYGYELEVQRLEYLGL